MVQNDLQQADEDVTQLEAALQAERDKRVGLEKGKGMMKGGQSGDDKASGLRQELAHAKKEAKVQLGEAQRQADQSRRDMNLQQDIHARQRSVYEAGLREMMRVMQLRGSGPESQRVDDLIEENDKLRAECADLRAQARARR